MSIYLILFLKYYVCLLRRKKKDINLCASSEQTTTSKVLTIPRQQGIFGKRATENKKWNWQSNPEEYPFHRHQIIRHQVHHNVLLLKEN